MKNFLKNIYRKLTYHRTSPQENAPSEDMLPISLNPIPAEIPGIDDTLKKQIEKELPSITGLTPDPKQKEVVTSSSNNICVWAGAGSGKTLSLVWRVIFMHVYLRIPLNEITVLSFTKKSVEKFREDLAKMLKLFKGKTRVEADPREIKASVRTFHSKILEFGRNSRLNLSPNRMFEHQKEENHQDKDEEELIDEIYNKSTIPPRQSELLKDIYRDLFRHDNEFQSDIKKLYRYYLTSISITDKEKYEYTESMLKIAQARDLDLTKRVHSVFKGKHIGLKEFTLNNTSTLTFHANGYVESLNLYIVFVPEKKRRRFLTKVTANYETVSSVPSCP